MLRVLLLLSLLLGQEMSWQRREVLFSPPRPPSCVFAVLAAVHCLGACCPARAQVSICTGEIEALVTSVATGGRR
jgi:hypothetical protein